MVALESILAVDVKSQTEKQIGGKGAMTELIISDLSLQVIEEAKTVEEAVNRALKADDLVKFAKKIHKGLTVQNQCAAIKLRAERRAGAILRNTKFDKGGGDRKSVDYKNHRLHAVTGDRVTLKSLGIRKFESCRWQTIASISRERFEEEIAKTIRGKKELTERQFIELARTIKIKEKFAMLANSDSPTCNVEDLLALANSGKKFGCIYIDPPWRVGKVPYPTMDVAEIAELPIAKLASDWSHVDLWTLDQYFCDAKDLLRKWGFEYKSPLIWAKTQMGRGSYWRSSHEYLLLGVRGGMPFRAHDVKSWIEAARTEHSVKPEIFREILERVSPGPYLELFARNNRPGWTCWGNEIERVKFLNSLTDDTKFEYDDVG